MNGDNREDTIFKVFKYLLPDAFYLSIIKTDFITFSDTFLYVFKNEKFFLMNLRMDQNIFYEKSLVILFYNFIIWIIILILNIIILPRVSKEITDPIKIIIHLVSSIGQKEFKEKKKEDINEVFCDDLDINELYLICKKLLNGGFQRNLQLKIIADQNIFLGDYSYNQISFIKSNNVIFDEVRIENLSNQADNSIFLYKKKSLIIKNINFIEQNENCIKNMMTETNFSFLNDEEKNLYEFIKEKEKKIKITQKNFIFENFFKNQSKIVILS